MKKRNSPKLQDLVTDVSTLPTLGTEVVKGNTDETSVSKKYRAWCFTSFEAESPVFSDYMQYLCYSLEVCPTTNKLHWQGFMRLKNANTIKAIQKWGYKFSKLIVASGTDEQNRTYCGGGRYVKGDKIKEPNETFVEFGEIAKQGKRKDLDEIKNEIMSGKKTVDQITVETPTYYHQYGRTLSKLEDIYLRKQFRTKMPKGIWYFGPTGTGKSHKAFENFNPETHYIWKPEKWQDGYTGQKTIIINDFRGNIPYAELLQLIDKWPFYVTRRGREPMPVLAETIIITSSLRPEEVYYNLSANDGIDQLLRRIDLIYLNEKYEC